MKLLLAVIVLACVAPGLPQLLRRRFREGEGCRTPENKIGECITSTKCPYIVSLFQTSRRNVARQYLRAAQKSCRNPPFSRDPMVCCTASKETTVPTPYIPTNPSVATSVNRMDSTTASSYSIPSDPTTASPQTSPTIYVLTNPSTASPSAVDFHFPSNPTTSSPSTSSTITTSSPRHSTPPDVFEGSETCESPDLLQGVCIPLDKCEILFNKLQKNPTDATIINLLKLSNKICNNVYARVCCPLEKQIPLEQGPIFPVNTDAIPTVLPTMEEGCGYTKRKLRKIVGGDISEVGAWPWIALIGYDDIPTFKCGGTLITSRHVLTAAHCIKSTLTFVRLGEFDLNTDTEANHIDVPVDKSRRHPKYNMVDGHSDIAMLFLVQNIKFSEFISPICLPVEKQIQSRSFLKTYPFVAGWGKTMEGGNPATVLQELQIPVLENSVCRDSYEKQHSVLSEHQFDSAIICAGELGGGKDTCKGDSGGPLMTSETFKKRIRYHLIGVVSYGIGCARPDTPGVYSRVTHFMDWIQKTVAEMANSSS